jgi:ribosomal protein L37E
MEIKHPNFISNNKVFCVRCQICGKENYALAVASGICVWCGEDHNKLREESIKPYILKIR